MTYYWYLWLYFVMLSILTCVSIGRGSVYEIKGKALYNYLYLLSILILILFAGVRGIHTGVDDWMYRGSFTELAQKNNTISINNLVEQFKYEPLTTYIMYFVSLFTNNPDVFMLCYAALSIIINTYTYKKFSPLCLISIAIYSSHLFINKEMNQIRFGLSSALFILSICFYSQEKYKCTFFFQVLAILAHQTAIAGCVIFFLKFIPVRRYLPFILVLISIPLGVIGGKILFGTYFAYLPQNVSNYEGGEFDTDMNIWSLANLKNVIFIFLFCRLLYSEEKKNSNIEYYALMTYAVGASVRIIFHDFSIIGGRVGNLFLQVEPLLISFVIFKYRKHVALCTAFVIFILTYYYYYNTILHPQSIMGYTIDKTFDIF